MKALPFLLAAFVSPMLQAEIKITVGEINDRRTTGKFFRGLDIELRVSGPELADCKGMKVTLKGATDDTGKTLTKTENGFPPEGFRPLEKEFGGFGEQKSGNDTPVKIEFENPPRAAKSLKEVSGELELLVPSRDPQSVISIPLGQNAGKPVANPALTAAGAEIVFKAPTGTDVSYTLKDPKERVAVVEICGSDGKALERNGTMTGSGPDGVKLVTASHSSALPAGAVAKVYLLTDKSRIFVPIALRDLPLP